MPNTHVKVKNGGLLRLPSLFLVCFYFEYVFCLFVTVTTCMYTLFLYWRENVFSPRTAATAGLGAFLGIGLFFGQLVLYMGIDAALQDISYTIRSRQYTPMTSAVNEEMVDFHERHRIVFFLNFYDGSVLRSPRKLLAFSLIYNCGAYSPVMCMPVMMIVAGFVLGRIINTLVLLTEKASRGPLAQRDRWFGEKGASLVLQVVLMTTFVLSLSPR